MTSFKEKLGTKASTRLQKHGDAGREGFQLSEGQIRGRSHAVILFIYLFTFEWQREGEILATGSFPKHLKQRRLGWDQNQQPGILFRFPTWISGTQSLGSSPAISFH